MSNSSLDRDAELARRQLAAHQNAIERCLKRQYKRERRQVEIELKEQRLLRKWSFDENGERIIKSAYGWAWEIHNIVHDHRRLYSESVQQLRKNKIQLLQNVEALDKHMKAMRIRDFPKGA